MKDSLIITNGDDAVARMREAGIRGEILPWRDILHEGPVPASLSLEELSAVRAQFLAQRGWLPQEALHAAFRSRDTMIRRHRDFESVVLWFEHDLYDQLQLIQLLDFFAGESRSEGVHLIQAGQYLGREKPKALKAHFKLMEPVTEAQFALGRLAWSGFRAGTPEPWSQLLTGTHILPFLRLAMLRLLEELPHPASGLSRTDWTILSLISNGVKSPLELYEAFTEAEEVFFMGDLSFYHALDGLGAGGSPLVAGLKGSTFSPSMPEEDREAYLTAELSCTHLGITVLAKKADALQQRHLDRHIGGYHLTSRAPWRWEPDTRQLLSPAA